MGTISETYEEMTLWLHKKSKYLFIYFIYSFFNVDNYRTNTVYNKRNSNKMLIDVKTLVKKPIDYNTLKKKIVLLKFSYIICSKVKYKNPMII